MRDFFQKFRGQQRLVHVFPQCENTVVLDDVSVGMVREQARHIGGQLRAAGEGVGGHFHLLAESEGDFVEQDGNGLIERGEDAAVKLMRVNHRVDVRPFAINGRVHSGFEGAYFPSTTAPAKSTMQISDGARSEYFTEDGVMAMQSLPVILADTLPPVPRREPK